MCQSDLHRVREVAQDQDLREIFQSALDELGERLAILDASGKIVWVNQAWRRFAARADAGPVAAAGPGANYLEVCQQSAAGYPSARDTLYGIYSVLEGLVDRYVLEYGFENPAQAPGWYRMTITPLRSAGGGLVISHGDITPQKLAEDERDRLNEDLQLAMASLHSLSTLMPVCGSCGQIRGDSAYFEQVSAYFRQHPGTGVFGVCPECHDRFFIHSPGEQAFSPAHPPAGD